MTRPAVFYSLAAVVPAAALWLATPAERAAHGLAVSPFGWPSMVLVHCLASLPLAAVVGGWVARRWMNRSPVPAAGAGVLFAVGWYFLAGPTGEVFDSFPADFATRSAARSLLCLLLALPWAAAARVDTPADYGSWAMLGVGLVAAFVLPGVWADKLAKEAAAAALDESVARRMTRAYRLVDGLCDLDPYRTDWINGPRHLIEYRSELAESQRRLAEHLASQNVASLRPPERLNHANALLSLDRLTEAESILRELVRTVPPANLPLARVQHLQGRYAESDAALQELLAAGLPVINTKPSIRKACLDAFDLLAENATKRGDNAAREAVLRKGLAAIPGEEAYFRFQLGRHYKMTGRPAVAVRELNEAVRLDKAFEPSAEVLIREMKELTPACLVGR